MQHIFLLLDNIIDIIEEILNDKIVVNIKTPIIESYTAQVDEITEEEYKKIDEEIFRDNKWYKKDNNNI